MQLLMTWWNTRLTPPTNRFINQPTKKELNEKVKKTIKYMCTEMPLDLIILCEVSERDRKLIEEIATEVDLKLMMLAERISTVYYDFAILYEETKIKIISHDPMDEINPFEQQLRAGIKVEAEFDSEEVVLFLSHWNSDLYSGDSKREDCAYSLRKEINKCLRNKKELIILAGDYNCQPFDDNIRRRIASSKDLDIVRDTPRVLYNPFWRNLDSRSISHEYSGSYINHADEYDKWKTVDQFMYSHHFIYGNTWKLDIYSSDIHNSFSALGFDFTETFDHLPIYGRITK